QRNHNCSSFFAAVLRDGRFYFSPQAELRSPAAVSNSPRMEGIMFRETLLESAPGARRRKRWPMVLAVALEVTVCSVLVAVPLFSSGIIVSAHTPIACPRFEPMPLVDSRPTTQEGGGGPTIPHASVVPVVDGKPHITLGPPLPPGPADAEPIPNIGGPLGTPLPTWDIGVSKPVGPKHSGPVVV